MTKYIFTAFLLCLGNIVFSQTRYTIEGSASTELEGDTIYLVLVEEDNRMADTTLVVNGKFRFEGETVRPSWAIVRAIKADPAIFVLENGTIRLHIDKNNYRCEGTPTNEIFQKEWQAFQALNKERLKTREVIDTMKVEKEKKLELYKKHKTESRELTKAFTKKSMMANLDNIIPAFWIRNFSPLFTQEEINEMIAGASQQLRENSFFQDIIGTQSGNHFLDVNVESRDGKKLKLSDILGKGSYVLVDVWASWCGSCIEAIPAVKAVGDKYASKGLKLVGISIDRDKDVWQKALEKLKIPWEQFHGDYSFVNTYGIVQIPVLMLVSPEGIIIKRGSKVEEFDRTLGELLK